VIVVCPVEVIAALEQMVRIAAPWVLNTDVTGIALTDRTILSGKANRANVG
jgi:hypothetical protein